MKSPIFACSLFALSGCFLSSSSELDGSGGNGASSDGGTTVTTGGETSDGGGGATSSTGGAQVGGSPTGGTSPEGGGGGILGDCDEGLSCVPSVVTGTFVAVAIGDQRCPDGYEDAVVVGDGDDPGCESCSCSMGSVGSCSPGDQTAYWETNCQNVAETNNDLADDECEDDIAGNGSQVDGHRLQPSTPSGGTCSAPDIDALPISVMTLCTPVDAADTPCQGGTCVTAPSAPFDRICNLLPEGETDCPAGYSASRTVHEVDGDSRQCDCECSALTPARCTGAMLHIYNGQDCQNNPVVSFPADGQCKAANVNHDSIRIDAGTWTAGTCGGQAVKSGSLDFGPALTLCCPN